METFMEGQKLCWTLKDGQKLNKLEVLRVIKKTKLNPRFGLQTKENSIQAGSGSFHSILAKGLEGTEEGSFYQRVTYWAVVSVLLLAPHCKQAPFLSPPLFQSFLLFPKSLSNIQIESFISDGHVKNLYSESEQSRFKS